MSLPGALREQLTRALSRMRELANQIKDIGVKGDQSRSDYLSAAQKVEPALDKLHLARVRKTQDAMAALLNAEELAKRNAIVLGVLALALSVVLAFRVTARVGRHIGAFVAHTREIAAGRFDAKPPDTGTTEFKALEGALGAMSTRLRDSDAEIRRAAALDRLLQNLATVANQAQSSAEGMTACLKLICDFTGWAIGHAALTEARGEHTVSKADFWHTAEPDAFKEFIQRTGTHYRLTPGSLIGQVFATKGPVWIKDVAGTAMRRAEAFREAGLVAGIALPVLVRGEVFGFLEFFSRAEAEPNPILLQALARAGGQLGRLVERTALEEQLLRVNSDLERRIDERTRELEGVNQALTHGHREVVLLSEMTNLLQTALDFDEAAVILKRFLERLFTPHDGALYLMRASLNQADLFARWGGMQSPAIFESEDCWALRRGQTYTVENAEFDIVCRHAEASNVNRPYACIPMMAQGVALGVLHVAFATGQVSGSLQERKEYAERVANQLAMALANLKLRQSLREQSIRDALTGLYNKRYLMESIERELARAAREQKPLAVLMLDVDHFKRFNDQHGHEAGDAILRSLGQVLKTSMRASDIACRYGGEEFTAVLWNAAAPHACAWAERLMERVRHMEIPHQGRPLPQITMSLGLAMYPQQGTTSEALLQAADAALYRAKRAGRDRLIVAELVNASGETALESADAGASAIGLRAQGNSAA